MVGRTFFLPSVNILIYIITMYILIYIYVGILTATTAVGKYLVNIINTIVAEICN